MAGEAHEGPRGAAARPQVGDLTEHQRFALEAGAREALGEELLATSVFGRYRPAADQRPGQVQDAAWFMHSRRS
jgi:hypothetical protein